jgi:hypothetical protein
MLRSVSHHSIGGEGAKNLQTSFKKSGASDEFRNEHLPNTYQLLSLRYLELCVYRVVIHWKAAHGVKTPPSKRKQAPSN